MGGGMAIPLSRPMTAVAAASTAASSANTGPVNLSTSKHANDRAQQVNRHTSTATLANTSGGICFPTL